MRTELTEILGTNIPVIAAPMAKASGSALAAAAAKAGALGCLAAGRLSLDRVTETYQAAVQQLEGKDSQHSALCIGLFNYSCSKVRQSSLSACLQVSMLDLALADSSMTGHCELQELLQRCIDLKPRAIWLSF